MAYIGNQPAESFTSFATQEFSTSATTSYTLNHAVTNENELALFVNNVRQQPGSGKAYTATGTALTLSAATASTDTMYCVFLGRALQTVVPATNSITAAMVGNDLISGKDALASEPADTDEFLVSDAGTLKRIDYSLIKGGGITMVDQFRLTTTFQGDAVPIASNLERVDTDGFSQIGTGMTESSGIFTFPATGIYLVQFNVHFTTNETEDSRYNRAETYVTLNNSSYSEANFTATGLPLIDSSFTSGNTHSQCIIDVTNTSNVKVKFHIDVHNSNMYVSGNTDRNETYMTFIRLGDT